MVIAKKHLKEMVKRLRNKSSDSIATYKITAVAYSNKGNILGYATNNVRNNLVPTMRGAGVHAERELVKRFGRKIKYIVISRFGEGGKLLPIDPCENCSKICEGLGIKIISLRNDIEK